LHELIYIKEHYQLLNQIIKTPPDTTSDMTSLL